MYMCKCEWGEVMEPLGCTNQLPCPHTNRQATLHAKGINFYASEVSLHEGNVTAGSAHACPQVR